MTAAGGGTGSYILADSINNCSSSNSGSAFSNFNSSFYSSKSGMNNTQYNANMKTSGKLGLNQFHSI